jgi:hypothetical protein
LNACFRFPISWWHDEDMTTMLDERVRVILCFYFAHTLITVITVVKYTEKTYNSSLRKSYE